MKLIYVEQIIKTDLPFFTREHYDAWLLSALARNSFIEEVILVTSLIDVPRLPKLKVMITTPLRLFSTLMALLFKCKGAKIIHVQFEPVKYTLSSLIELFAFLFVTKFFNMQKFLHFRIITTFHGPILKKNTMNDIIDSLLPANWKIPIVFTKICITFTYIVIGKLSSVVIVHAQTFKRILNSYGVRNCFVIPHGVRENVGLSTVSNNVRFSGQGIILFFGTLSPRKGLEHLIQAFSDVIKKGEKDLTLVIAGDEPINYKGYKKKLINIVNSLAIEHKVIFTGRLSDDLIQEFFRRAEIIIFPYPYSISASGPLSTAIEYGKPIIATATEYFSEILEHNRDALLVPPKDVEALVNAILTLKRDPRLTQQLSKNIRLKAETFTWKKIANMTVDLYITVLTNRLT